MPDPDIENPVGQPNLGIPPIDMPTFDMPNINMPINEDINYSNFMDFYKDQPSVGLMSPEDRFPDGPPPVGTVDIGPPDSFMDNISQEVLMSMNPDIGGGNTPFGTVIAPPPPELPLTNAELKEKILSGELPMSMAPKPDMQPELPVGIAPPNTASPRIVPQGDDGRVVVDTGGGRGGKGTRMGTQMPNGTVILDGGLQAIMPDGNVIDLGRPKRNEISIEEEMVTPPKPEPKKKSGRKRGGGRGGRAVGGSTDSESMLIEIVQKDPLASEVVQFVLGNSDNQEVIPAFVEKYGNELFLQLREAVLQELAPNAQTEGLIEGVGNGGMDDDINGIIGDKEKIAVSQDEFIIPADVVSMLGDGSSQAGSEELYGMMDRVRQTKTGTTEQAPRLANKGGLLPA